MVSGGVQDLHSDFWQLGGGLGTMSVLMDYLLLRKSCLKSKGWP